MRKVLRKFESIKDTNERKIRKERYSLIKEQKKNKRQQHLEKLVAKFKEEKKDNMKRGTEKEEMAERN